MKYRTYLTTLAAALSLIGSAYAAPTKVGLVAHYTFDSSDTFSSGGNTFTADSSGFSHDGQRSGDVSSVQGVFGQAAYFDGDGDYFSVAATNVLKSPSYTFSSYVKFEVPNEPSADIWSGYYHNSTVDGGGYRISVGADGAGNDGLFTRPTGNFGSAINTPAQDRAYLVAGQWHHLATSWDGQVAKLYLDGILRTTFNPNELPQYQQGPLRWSTYPSSQPFGIGRNFDITTAHPGYYKGALDDLRIYNRALSDSEVAEFAVDSVPAPAGFWIMLTGVFGMLIRSRLHFASAAMTGVFALFLGSTSASAALVAHYALDGNGLDALGGHNGSVFGATAVADRFGTNGAAMRFDGIDDVITVAASPVLRSAHYSVSFYAQTTSVEEGYVWDGQYNDSPTTASGYGVYISGDTPNEPVIGGPSVSQLTQPSGNVGAKSSVSINDGAWHHVAATYDGVVSRVFVDGMLTATAFPVAGPIRWQAPQPTHTFYIGRLSPALITGLPGRFFNGVLDDLRIFDNALNQGQIASLAGVPVSGTVWLFLTGGLGLAARRWRANRD